MFGNQNVGRVLQTKLAVSEPGDAYERQADAVAEMVMRMPGREAPAIAGDRPDIQRKCSACEEEDETLRFKRSPGSVPEVTPSVGANIDALRGSGQPLAPSARAFFEPRFGYDFGDVRVHTTGRALEAARQVRAQAFTVGRDVVFGAGQYNPETQPGRQLLAHELTHVVQQTPMLSRKSSVIQRMPETNEQAPAATEQPQESAGPTEEAAPAQMSEATPAAKETATPGWIVDDSVEERGPGQMKKSDFLTELHAEVCSAAEEILASTGRTTEGCPYLDYWFNYYGNQDSLHIERAIQRYSPEASGATTARDYIPIITARVRRGVEVWARSGELSEVPEGVPMELPGAGSTPAAPAAAPDAGSVQFKSRSGGPKAAGSPQAIQAQLGRGRSLDGNVRSRMESAFGTSFSHVRVHTDGGAANVSDTLNARAFTVGEHVAFGSGEYRPGTPIGDAIIAHEMAHVVQQRGASPTLARAAIGDTGYNALEEDADVSAMGAVASLWSGAKGAFGDIAKNAMPRLRSGLSLRRCPCDKDEETIRYRYYAHSGFPDAEGYCIYCACTKAEGGADARQTGPGQNGQCPPGREMRWRCSRRLSSVPLDTEPCKEPYSGADCR